MQKELYMLRHLPEFLLGVAIAVSGGTAHLSGSNLFTSIANIFDQSRVKSIPSGYIVQYAMDTCAMLYSQFFSIGISLRNARFDSYLTVRMFSQVVFFRGYFQFRCHAHSYIYHF